MCLTCGCGNEDDVRIVTLDAQGQQHHSIVLLIIISMIIIITTMVITSTMITINRVRMQPTPYTPRLRSLRV